MGDSVPKHTGPNSLTDTLPRTERLRNPTDHQQKSPQRWKAFLPETLKLLAAAIKAIATSY